MIKSVPRHEKVFMKNSKFVDKCSETVSLKSKNLSDRTERTMASPMHKTPDIYDYRQKSQIKKDVTSSLKSRRPLFNAESQIVTNQKIFNKSTHYYQ